VLVPFGNGLLWYWGTGNTDTDGRTSLWYPSVEVFRQAAPGSWGDPLVDCAQRVMAEVRPRRPGA
jgi:hypothetical protein